MDIEVRRVLTHAELRAREPGLEPAEFASIYALCVGIIMGATAAGGMSEAEAQEARAYLMMLEVIYQVTHQYTTIR
ncbi:MAG: hypothetical protein WDN04_05395 [Rhodospirillales bacterium]